MLNIQLFYYEDGWWSDIKPKEAVYIAVEYFIKQGSVLEIHLEDGSVKGIPLFQIREYKVTEEKKPHSENGIEAELDDVIRQKRKETGFRINVEQYYTKRIAAFTPFTWSKLSEGRAILFTMNRDYFVSDYTIKEGSVLEMCLINGCVLGIPLCQIREYEVEKH